MRGNLYRENLYPSQILRREDSSTYNNEVKLFSKAS